METKLAKCKIINIDLKMITTLTPSVSKQKNGINLSRRQCRVSGLCIFLKQTQLKMLTCHGWHVKYLRILLMDKMIFAIFSIVL